MRAVVATCEKLADLFRVVPLVEAHVLRMPRPGLRTLDRQAIECRLKKFNVVRVGTTYRYAQRNAASVGENRTFGTELTTIGRVLACIFPRPEAIWSSLRPCSASSSQSLFARRIRAIGL